jgi:hypothetical protein
VQAQAAVELAAIGLTASESDPARSALARVLKEARGADATQAQAWLAALERRVESAPAPSPEAAHAVAAVPAPAPSSNGAVPARPSDAAPPAVVALPHPAAPITATTLAPVASAAAAALTPAPAAVNASFGAANGDWPVTVIPNPAWAPSRANGATSSPAAPPAAGRAPVPGQQPACTAEPSRCPPRDTRPGG